MCAIETVIVMLFAMAVLTPAGFFAGLLYVLSLPYPAQRRRAAGEVRITR